jgi:cobalt-zinc-cadmium efflux system membrane fusion protein
MRNKVWESARVKAAAACLVTICMGCSHKSEAPGAPEAALANVTLSGAQRQKIRLYTIAPMKFRNAVEATGVVDFDNDQATSVLAPFSGPVSKLLVALGAEVKKGDPLAAVDSPDFAAAISAYHKALATAQTNRRLADLDKDLVQHNGIAQREAAQAETDAANAEADRDASLQALVSLNVPAQTIKDIENGRPVAHPDALIRAPIAGTVVEKLITPGQLLESGTTPCFTVANLSRVWVMAQIYGADVAGISVGDTAEVFTDTVPQGLSGRVDYVSALVNSDTRSVTARIVADNPGRYLKKQMYVRVLIHSKSENTGLLVPVSSLLRDDENLPFVYLAQPDGSFARQHVTVALRTEDQYVIAAGVKPGDQIVVDGGIFVQFMQSQ